MKKNIITILLISLTIILCSCDNETEELSQYDETTNQHISAFGISLQIPKEWEEEIHEHDCLQYYEENEDSFEHGLNITLQSDEESLKEAVETLKENLETSNEKYHDLEDITFSEGKVADMAAVTAEYVREFDGKKYEYKIVVFQKNNGIVMIPFSSEYGENLRFGLIRHQQHPKFTQVF